MQNKPDSYFLPFAESAFYAHEGDKRHWQQIGIEEQGRWIAAVKSVFQSLNVREAATVDAFTALILDIEPGMIADTETVRVNERLKLARNKGDQQFAVWLEDQCVPNISAVQTFDGTWHVSLDNRFGFNLGRLDAEQLEQMVRLLANSMAVAAGFSSFGEHSSPINIYKKYPPPPAEVNIGAAQLLVNGEPCTWLTRSIGYDSVISLAFGADVHLPEGSRFTMQYTRGAAEKPSGTLLPGQSVPVVEGMVFDVAVTNRA